jgi:hypothetical protein
MAMTLLFYPEFGAGIGLMVLLFVRNSPLFWAAFCR